MGTKAETIYQGELVKKLEDLFPDCFVTKLNPEEWQGIPDLLILFEDKWAMLEVKTSESAVPEPNQDFYILKFNEMSFAAFIHPASEEMVLQELLMFFGS